MTELLTESAVKNFIEDSDQLDGPEVPHILLSVTKCFHLFMASIPRLSEEHDGLDRSLVFDRLCVVR